MGQKLLAALAGALILCAALPATAEPLSGYRLLVLDGHTVKWGSATPGSGAVVTYALADADVHADGARNCAGLGPFDWVLQRSGIGRPAFDAELKAAFAAWQDIADIRFEPADPATAEILIGSELQPRGRAFTNVATETPAPAAGPSQIKQALICLNPLEPWKVGFNGDLDVYDLRYSLMHEIGHAIGLDHPSAAGEVMDFKYAENFRVPQAGDAEGAVALYGPAGNAPVIASRAAGSVAQTERGLGEPASEPPADRPWWR